MDSVMDATDGEVRRPEVFLCSAGTKQIKGVWVCRDVFVGEQTNILSVWGKNEQEAIHFILMAKKDFLVLGYTNGANNLKERLRWAVSTERGVSSTTTHRCY